MKIIERRDDDAAMRIGPTEINAGLMALDAHWARSALDQVRPSGASGEFYLTDLVSIAAAGARTESRGRSPSWWATLMTPSASMTAKTLRTLNHAPGSESDSASCAMVSQCGSRRRLPLTRMSRLAVTP